MRAFPALMHVSFQNIIRQSFFALALIGGYLFIASTPAFTMFTFLNAEKLLLDMSMAMILLSILTVSILATSSIVGGEMEEKTATLLLSKPLSRLTFILAKFCAVAVALLFILIPLTSCLIMTLTMGVPEAAYSKVQYSILWFEFLPLLAAVIVAALANYYADKNFASSFIILVNVFLVISLVILNLTAMGALRLNLFYPSILLWMGGVLICPVALILALRGKVFFTLTFSFLIFALGLTSNWLFANFLGNPGIRMLYSIIPNFQIFWIEKLWAKENPVTVMYFWNVLKYVTLYSAGMICLAWSIWERREISGGR